MSFPISFDPRKFLELANKLILDGEYERNSRARTAMGRIYYATFLLALQKLQEKGISVKDDTKIHEVVIQTYNDKGLSLIGNGLDQLREKRVDADYHMTVNITLDDCKKHARFSEYIIGLIDQIAQIR